MFPSVPFAVASPTNAVLARSGRSCPWGTRVVSAKKIRNHKRAIEGFALGTRSVAAETKRPRCLLKQHQDDKRGSNLNPGKICRLGPDKVYL